MYSDISVQSEMRVHSEISVKREWSVHSEMSVQSEIGVLGGISVQSEMRVQSEISVQGENKRAKRDERAEPFCILISLPNTFQWTSSVGDVLLTYYKSDFTVKKSMNINKFKNLKRKSAFLNQVKKPTCHNKKRNVQEKKVKFIQCAIIYNIKKLCS